MLKNILLVGLGGFTGSIARYLVYVLLEKHVNKFPWSTFGVNIIGSLILGLLAALLMRNQLSDAHRLLLSVGFCGSFTTFSAFAFENFEMLNQKPLNSLLYISASLVVGIVMVFVGFSLGKQI